MKFLALFEKKNDKNKKWKERKLSKCQTKGKPFGVFIQRIVNL